eukprot:CAMPEP_0203782452 /NCGR_PEP_ID=MMETSP0099_2-20121227/11042_1 /ASSEMBLY_ACC=CAM_ASM_000209 /TAXON_ID=96639 /ORGANISM=" , Strain NY0313808BC1" /LENGTH=572 /DNA_ID=CAMNT_0050684037 /DNA_START=71 /DNA_END=1788 /DNA_ORIENTATION=-
MGKDEGKSEFRQYLPKNERSIACECTELAGDIVRENEWVVLVCESGQSMLVQAKKNRRSIANQLVFRLDALVGARFGSCFSMELVRDGKAKEEAWENSTPDELASKLESRLARRRRNLENASKKRKKQKLENGQAAVEEECKDLDDIYTLERTGPIGRIPEPTTDELQERKKALLKELREIDGDLSESNFEDPPAEGNSLKTNQFLYDTNRANQKMETGKLLDMAKEEQAEDVIKQLVEHSATYADKTEYYSNSKRLNNTLEDFVWLERQVRRLGTPYGMTNYLLDSGLATFAQWIPCHRCYHMPTSTTVAGCSYLIPWVNMSQALFSKEWVGLVGCTMGISILSTTTGCSISSISLKRISMKHTDLVRVIEGDDGYADKVVLENKIALLKGKVEEFEKEIANGIEDEQLEKVRKHQVYSVKRSLHKMAAKIKEKQSTYDADAEAYRQLREEGVDSIVLAARFDMRTVFPKILHYLAPSGSFVIFSEYPSELVSFKTHLEKNRLAANVKVFESFYREYQILPNKTHPMMSMSSRGGFFLYGIKSAPARSDEFKSKVEITKVRAQSQKSTSNN